jgi:undecaprenyl-diphosphatase
MRSLRAFRSRSGSVAQAESVSIAHTDLIWAEHANHFAARHDGWEDAARVWASVSEPLFLVLVVGLVLVGLAFGRHRVTVAGVVSGLAAGLALLVGAVISSFVDRPRPFVAHPGEIHAFLSHAADPGFPSDHALAAFAIAGVLLVFFGLRALPVLAGAVALAVARVMVGVHYPGDVLSAALIGLGAAAILCAVARLPRVAASARALDARVPHPLAGSPGAPAS